MGRKTFEVGEFVRNANEKLAGWTQTPEERQGIITMVADLLHATGNYRGFNYLSENELSEQAHDCARYFKNQHQRDIDTRPGIRYGAGCDRYVDGVDTWFEDTDVTRVYFYPPDA